MTSVHKICNSKTKIIIVCKKLCAPPLKIAYWMRCLYEIKLWSGTGLISGEIEIFDQRWDRWPFRNVRNLTNYWFVASIRSTKAGESSCWSHFIRKIAPFRYLICGLRSKKQLLRLGLHRALVNVIHKFIRTCNISVHIFLMINW